MPNQRGTVVVLAIFALSCLLPNLGTADESNLINTIRNLEKQMADMQQVIQDQNQKIAALENKEPVVQVVQQPAPPAQPGFADPYFENNLKNYMGDSYQWLKDLKFNGDLRLRYEGWSEHSGSVKNADRNRFRFRLRFGFKKKLSPDMEIGFRLVSGPRTATGTETIGQINSTNQTLDNNFDFKDISIDQAYAKYTPAWAEVGPIKGVTLTGGKFSNPFGEKGGSTWMIWDTDVTPEGAYEKIDLGLISAEDLNIDMVLLAGQLILEEGALSDNDDAEMFAYQGGFKTQISNILPKAIKTKHFVSFYDYRDFTNNNYQAAGGNFTGGTSLAAGAFKVLDIYNEIAFDIPGMPHSSKYLEPLSKVTFYHDFLYNLGEDAASKALGEGQNKGWLIGGKLGEAKDKGTWEAVYEYAWLEANATASVFSDAEFGGTNRRGSIFRLKYKMTDNLALQTAGFFTNNILTGTSADIERRVFQVDLVWEL
ncbi:MAG: putative porin [Candidatus Omnitrophota bacterium]